MEALLAGVVGIVVGGGVSFAGNYFLNVQRYKQETNKQGFDHNHDLVKQDSEHKYERQVFLRQKYEELTFRLIEFTNILKALSSQLSQEVSEADIIVMSLQRKVQKSRLSLFYIFLNSVLIAKIF